MNNEEDRLSPDELETQKALHLGMLRQAIWDAQDLYGYEATFVAIALECFPERPDIPDLANTQPEEKSANEG